jgi:hypothetical protein
LIGPKVPVQGLLIDIETGNLEWLVNGYDQLGAAPTAWSEVARSAGQMFDALKPLTGFNLGEMKFPETKIGELAGALTQEIVQRIGSAGATTGAPATQADSAPTAPTGFTIGELKVPQKLGDLASIIESEFELRVPSAAGLKAARPGGAPPKIPVPPPLRPKPQLRKGHK